MKVFNEMVQGSDEWKAIRKGKPTASNASDIITPAKGEMSRSARKYIFSLIADCGIPGEDIPEFETLAMNRGKEMEPEAREAFATETGLSVVEVGLIVADDNICACSPDGLIRACEDRWAAGLEIKCPLKDAHTEYVLEGVLPDAHKAQVHWSLAVTGFQKWHFWSWHPRAKPLHVIVERDAYTAKVEEAMREFVNQYREAYALAKEKVFIPVELLEEDK